MVSISEIVLCLGHVEQVRQRAADMERGCALESSSSRNRDGAGYGASNSPRESVAGGGDGAFAAAAPSAIPVHVHLLALVFSECGDPTVTLLLRAHETDTRAQRHH